MVLLVQSQGARGVDGQEELQSSLLHAHHGQLADHGIVIHDQVALTLPSDYRRRLRRWGLAAGGALLDPTVRRSGAEDTPETCHTRSEVLSRLAGLATSGTAVDVIEATAGTGLVLLGLRVRCPVNGAVAPERSVYQVMSLRGGRPRPYDRLASGAREIARHQGQAMIGAWRSDSARPRTSSAASSIGSKV